MHVIALAAAAAAGLASTAAAAPAEAAAAAAAPAQPTPLAKRAAGGDGFSLKLPLQQWKRELNSPEDVIASARRQRDYIMDKYYGVFNTTERSAYRKMRLQQKLAHAKRDGGIVGLTDVGPDSYYFAQVAIGTPAQNLAIVLDTGSADLWVPANECTSSNCRGLAKFDEQASSTYQSSPQPFSIQYGQGAVQGHMAADTVSLAGYTVYSQSFAVATQIADDTLSAPASGLMGMGFQQLSSSGVTPFWEVLAKSGKLAANAFSFQLARNPTAGPTDQSPGGVFTLGEVDSNQYSGSINYVQIPQRYQAYGYWAVNLDSISLNGGNNVQVNQLAAIDTGTTLIAAPTRTAQAIYAAIPGSAPFSQLGQGYYQYPCSTNVQVQFTFGGKAYSVNPVDFNAGAVDNFGRNCLGSIFGMDTGGAAPPFIVGDAFLKSVFSVYQYNPPAVGFASLKGAGAQTAATSGGLKTATDAAVSGGSGALPTDTGLPQGLTQTVDQTRATGTSIYGASGVSAPSAAGTNANKNPSLGGGSSSNAGGSGSGSGRSAAASVHQPLHAAASAVVLAITAGAAFTILL